MKEAGAPSLHIAILKCDVFTPSIQEVAGGYGDLFESLFKRAIAAMDSPMQVKLSLFEVTEEQYPADPSDFDAILITGSKFGVNDKDPWIHKLIEYVQSIGQKTKIIGICFGHQVVAKAFGGEVETNTKGWEVGWTQMALTKEGKEFFGERPEQLSFLSMHKDHVTKVPSPEFQVLFSTDVCPIQSMRKGDSVLTIQGHPEFQDGLVREVIRLRTEAKVFSEEFAAKTLAMLDEERPRDDVWFAVEILRFLCAKT
ncbi:hypothetical protein HDU97_009855 [Phlyctochytrium planicorne]|nr:hypothetical protein HDU97_009855 [Phlyctochytrium planicorne]